MALQVINVGAAPNDGTGDPIRTAYIKCNTNFAEIYSRAQTSPPLSLVGSPGDQAGMYAYDSTYWYYCYANYDGSSEIWGQLTQLGNVSVSEIINGTSNVNIATVNGNATVSIGGTSNVAVFTTTGQYVTGFVSATGNVSGAYILGNGSLLTGIPSSYTDSNVTTLLAAFGSNTVSTSGNITGGNVLTSGSISATGNVTGGNIRTAGVVSATGNISGNYFIGNGSLLTGIAGGSGYSDSNVTTLLAAFGSNTVSTTGTITGGNITGGNLLTSGLISSTGAITSAANITGGNVLTGGLISATSTITGSNLLTGGIASATGNITGGNILTGGLISATSTITSGANITGGNLLTSGLISSTGAITSAANITGGNVLTGGLISATGTITGGNITGSNLLTSGLISATGNITSGGNVAATYFIGDGSQLTGLPANYGNTQVAAYLPTYTGNLNPTYVSVGANLSVGSNLSVGGHVSVSGNVSVVGNINGKQINGQLTGTVNGLNPVYGVWDFGSITGLTFETPIAWIFAQTGVGNIDMGTISAPSTYEIDIGTIY